MRLGGLISWRTARLGQDILGVFVPWRRAWADPTQSEQSLEAEPLLVPAAASEASRQGLKGAEAGRGTPRRDGRTALGPLRQVSALSEPPRAKQPQLFKNTNRFRWGCLGHHGRGAAACCSDRGNESSDLK